MHFDHFIEGSFGAAANMARDLLLLEAYPDAEALRLRHYGWTKDCFTFGYSQKYEWIKGQAIRGADLARRPTGGGLVDHRADWTFALVIPASHSLHHAPALEVYRLVHDALARALSSVGRPATLQPEKDASPLFPGTPSRVRGLCFAGAEVGDVIDPESRIKIAGAAMKRNTHGLLMQGSIDRMTAGELDWERFGLCFIANLAASLGSKAPHAVTPPQYPADTLAAAVEKLSADAWNKRR